MARRNRKTLRKYFARGKMPTEEHFTDLVDSMINIVDEGFDKSLDKGLSLAPLDEDGHLITIFKKIEDENHKWTIQLDKGTENLSVKQFNEESVITLDQNGNTGFGTNKPIHQIHTTRTAGLHGRAGTYATGIVPANGEWHTILSELEGCFAFEIIAGSGKPRGGKYALIIANAISCFGSRRKISQKQSWYGIRCNRIKLRWQKNGNKVSLQIKTRCNYGQEMQLQYNVSSLWENNRMQPIIKGLDVNE